MNETVEKIKNIFHQNGISIYGICDEELVRVRRKGYRPSDLLPSAKSVISIALPLPKGIYQCKKNMAIPYWWNSNLYFNKLDEIMLEISTILEEDGHTALTINGCFPIDVNLKGEFVGFTSIMHMAEASKIGKIGKNGLLFSSKYGPRLILGGLVTSAHLPSVTMPEVDEKGCPDDCFICQKSCPAGAIDKNGNVDIYSCINHSGESPVKFVYPLLFRILIPFLSKLKIVDINGVLPPKLQRLFNITFANTHGLFACIDCVSQCPYVANDMC